MKNVEHFETTIISIVVHFSCMVCELETIQNVDIENEDTCIMHTLR